MPIIEIDGIGKVEPDPSFFQLPPEQQAKEVDALVKSYQAQQPDPAQAAAAENRANFVKSAANTASNIVQPIIHPIQTAENIGTIGKGIMQKVGVVPGNDAVPAADAVWQSLVDRYGSAAAIKKTIHEDPVGFLMDASTVLSGGGTALAKAGGVAGKVGEIAAEAGNTFNPLAVAGRAAAPIAGAAGKVGAEAAGLMTGAGPEAVKTAFRAGAEGGAAQQAFKEGMTGANNAAAAVSEAKGAVSQLRAERGAAYRDAMDKLRAGAGGLESPEANQILNFDKIDQAVAKVAGIKNFKGQDISPKTADIRAELTQAVDDWKALPPDQFHTVEGLDALKQKLGDIRDNTQPNTPARVVADQIYQGVRNTIIDQAPEYAKIMKGYEEASGIIREIEKTLSLNPSATIDTSLRKLQSVLRNNVSTNYGRRAELVDFLTRAGAPHLMERLSGQMLSSFAPRGLSRVVAGGEGVSALGALALGHPGAAAGLGAGILASSPAIVGTTANMLGGASRLPAAGLGQAAFQLGRLGQ